MHCLQQNLSNLNEILHQGIMQCNMNDLMSFFMAAFWKHVAAEYDNPNFAHQVAYVGVDTPASYNPEQRI